MKKIILAAALAAICLSSKAQELQTGYFSPVYAYSYNLNPAFHSNYSIVALPVIGSTSLGFLGNIGMASLLYPQNGNLVTFMHPDVSAEDALAKFSNGSNLISTDVSANLLSIGVRTGKLYNVIDLSLRASVDGSLPYDLFRFLKTGTSETDSYDFSGLNFRGTAFAQIGIGSSWKRGDLTIGVKMKGLVGLAGLDVKMDRMNMRLTGDEWTVSADGTLSGAYDAMKIATKKSSTGAYSDIIDFENSEFDKRLGFNGFGLAVDFGLAYKVGPVVLSAAVTDLGGINWFNNLRGRTAVNDWKYSGSKDIDLDEGSTIGDELSNVADEFSELFEFRKEDEESEMRMLPATVRVGAKYNVVKNFSVGLLGTYKFNSLVPYREARVALNYNPFKALDITGSAGVSNYGATLGGLLNIKIPGFTLFFGMESILGKISPQGIPLEKMNSRVTFGANISW